MEWEYGKWKANAEAGYGKQILRNRLIGKREKKQNDTGIMEIQMIGIYENDEISKESSDFYVRTISAKKPNDSKCYQDIKIIEYFIKKQG